jgi:hypothetical protein
VRKVDHILESDLGALDEALRYSARIARWPEGDTGAEGKRPDEIQQHPVGIFADFKARRTPRAAPVPRLGDVSGDGDRDRRDG